MSTVYTTVNASFRHAISEERLAEILKKGLFPEEFREHLYVFFTEVPISAIYSFMKEYQLSHEELLDYYKKYIKHLYTNKELEEMLTIG
jgi:hypothetical protein